MATLPLFHCSTISDRCTQFLAKLPYPLHTKHCNQNNSDQLRAAAIQGLEKSFCTTVLIFILFIVLKKAAQNYWQNYDPYTCRSSVTALTYRHTPWEAKII